MIRTVLTSGYHRANGQSWIKPVGGVECGVDDGMLWAVAVSPPRIYIREVSIGIRYLFGMLDTHNGHIGYGILLGLQVKRGKRGISSAVGLGYYKNRRDA